jgi:hypothetical protein
MAKKYLYNKSSPTIFSLKIGTISKLAPAGAIIPQQPARAYCHEAIMPQQPARAYFQGQ